MENQDTQIRNNKDVRKNILFLLRAFPHLIENRNRLVSYYWVFCDRVTSLEEVANATSVETITRNLRRLLKQGLVKQPDQKKKFKEKEFKFKHEFSSLR